LQFSEYAPANSSQSAPDTEVSAYWLKRFEQIPPVLDYPSRSSSAGSQIIQRATYRARIDAPICKQIKQAGAKQGCTLFATLLTGFAALLHRLTAQNDLVIGIPTAGQSLLENGSLVRTLRKLPAGFVVRRSVRTPGAVIRTSSASKAHRPSIVLRSPDLQPTAPWFTI